MMCAKSGSLSKAPSRLISSNALSAKCASLLRPPLILSAIVPLSGSGPGLCNGGCCGKSVISAWIFCDRTWRCLGSVSYSHNRSVNLSQKVMDLLAVSNLNSFELAAVVLD